MNMQTIKLQSDYTVFGAGCQLAISLQQEIKIPKDDPVRLLNAVIERMDLRKLAATYPMEGKIEHEPASLLKVVIYAKMRRIFGTRSIEEACRENVNFMFLLNGRPAPDHNTLHRFIKHHFEPVCKDLQRQLTQILMELGEVSFAESAVFIDGTKIEANANRYRFVWKTATVKNYEKLQAKMKEELPKLIREHGLHYQTPDEIRVRHLKKILKKLKEKGKKQGLVFVSGKGKHKTPLQRAIETVEEWLRRAKKYIADIHICGERNSYCKTDHDATFMRMKEDHMLNGQLKPGYNVNVATVSEYIVGSYISSDRTDTKTLIPFLEELKQWRYPMERIVVDAGYESEENYRYFERETNLSLFVKPMNHEKRKTKKYRTDIGRRENMPYDPATDTYTCAQGRTLNAVQIRKTKSAAGFPTETTVYECESCEGCPCKEKCIRKGTSRKPVEERTKRLNVSKYFAEQREAMEAKINTPEGIQLRMNRSIMSEGVFAMIKEDLRFRRFLTRGIQTVTAEWYLMAFAYNILKLHHRIQNGRLGTHLYETKAA